MILYRVGQGYLFTPLAEDGMEIWEQIEAIQRGYAEAPIKAVDEFVIE